MKIRFQFDARISKGHRRALTRECFTTFRRPFSKQARRSNIGKVDKGLEVGLCISRDPYSLMILPQVHYNHISIESQGVERGEEIPYGNLVMTFTFSK